MRDTIAKAYQYILQAAGTYGALVALVCFAGLPARLSAGQSVIVPLAVTATALLIAVTLMRPSLVPVWFLSPRRPAQLLPVLLGNGMLPMLFVLPCMGAAAVFHLPEPFSRALATGLAAVPFGLFGLALLAGLALCLWPEHGDNTAQAPVVPRRPQIPRLSPEAQVLRRRRST
ncbi:hypothetical protein JF540_07995 [Salipiger thiooxidans]|uniref:hypothetical protein n=1 Tax=Salipiger thiooxidans TaxID=282683 RepID=UPI001A8C83D4|nr:hypothetical protein [Salipiger thiooxidans]MBN8186628.1 hypothetical protein [Salipiger thiooxidans]